MTNRVRIHDVAKAAEVSIGTVSDALNGKGRMSEATRERVRAAAAALGYRPHFAARSLRQGRSGLIGLILRPFSDAPSMLAASSYFNELISAATTDALADGYSMVVIPAGMADDGALWLPLDGAMVADPLDDDPLIAALKARGIPVLTGWTGDPEVLCIDHDHRSTMRAVLAHLLDQGATRMGLLTGDEPDWYTRTSVAAFHEFCDEHGLARVVEAIRYKDNEPYVDGALRLLEHRPDAVFSLDELVGHAMLDAARRCGLRIPDDLMVVCTDDVAYATTSPPLSTLGFQPRRMSEEGTALMAQALRGDFPAEPHRLIPTVLTIRESSARHPVQDSRIVIEPRPLEQVARPR